MNVKSQITKAVLLAAGKGARMKELTDDLPKPMIPVAGIPILERILNGLISANIHDFLIITGHKADIIQSHFGNGSRWNISITYKHQVIQDGTGRVVELAHNFAKETPFLLSYGDILVSPTTYLNIQTHWTQTPSDGILTVKLGEDIHKGAVAIFDDDFTLRELIEKPNPSEIKSLRLQFGNFKPWYNAGIYVFTPNIFKYTERLQRSPRGEYELTDAIRQMTQDKLKIHGLIIHDYWADIRDPDALIEANRRFSNN